MLDIDVSFAVLLDNNIALGFVHLLFTLFSSGRPPRSLTREAACGVSPPSGEGWRGPLLAVQTEVGIQIGRERGVFIFRAVHNERVDDGRREVQRTRSVLQGWFVA